MTTPCRCRVLAVLAILVATASFCSAQTPASLPRMHFADAVSGRPFSKDPAVVKFRDRYWLYYSLPPYEGKPTKGWCTGVAASKDLVDGEKAGELTNTGDAEQNGFCAPGAIVLAGKVFDAREFGAIGDGKTLSTAAIQKAIDQCAAQGGGAVRLPAGTWLCGTVYLQSNLTLVLEKGCTLLGSRKHEDYALPRAAGEGKPAFRYAAILAGSDLHGVTIRGEGTIDGQGDAFLDKSRLRPKGIYLQRCRNVTVEGLRMRNAGSWMQHYRHCEDLTIRGIDVFNHAAYNNDGLNVDSCTRVLIEKCRVDSDDDGIVLKSLSLDPCRHVAVRDCTVSSHCNAIKMGTESGGGFQDVEVARCTVHSPKQSKKIYGTQRGLAGIALEIVDGGTMDRVTVSDVRIDGVTAAVFVRLGNRARSYVSESPKPGVGTLRNVLLRNITAENTSEIGCSITGLPGHPVRNVVLENVTLGFDGGGAREQAARQVPERPESYPESTMFGTLPAYGFYCRHAEGLVFRNVVLRTRRPDLRHAMLFDDVKDLQIEALQADWTEGAAATLRMVQVDGAAVRRTKAPAGARPFLLLEGDKTRRIVLKDNELGAAAQAVEFGPGASAEAITAQEPTP